MIYVLAGLPVWLVVTSAATNLVSGVVVDQDSAWQDGVIVTRSTIETSDGERIDVRVLGGVIGAIGQRAAGDAWLELGERVRVELEWRAGAWVVAGGERGVLHLDRYVRTSSGPFCPGYPPRPLAWFQLEVPFVLDAAGSDDIAPAEAHAALRASFDTWQVPACSYLRFRDDGVVADAPVGYVPSGPNLQVVKWVESGWAQSTRALAVTLSTFDCNDGRLLDADILFNGELFAFTTSATAGAADIQNTATHEVGHLIGFDHSPDPESTMFADAPTGETKKRDLTDDDLLGLCTVYALGSEPGDAGPDAPPPGADAGPGADGEGGGCGCRSEPQPASLALAAPLLVMLRRRRRGARA